MTASEPEVKTAIQEATAAIVNFNTNLDEVKETSRRNRRNLWVAVGLVILTSLLGWVVMGFLLIGANHSADDAKNQLAAYKNDQEIQRQIACTQAVDSRDVRVTSNIDAWRLLNAKVLAANVSPEAQEFFNDFTRDVVELIRNGQPVRDCTPQGIEGFYAKQGGYLDQKSQDVHDVRLGIFENR